MDIKRVNPGPPNLDPSSEKPEIKGSQPFDPTQGQGAIATPAGLAAVETQFKRADLNSDRRSEVISAAISSLLDRNAATLGNLPPATRQQIAGLLASDPFFSKRLSQYLEQKLT